LDGCLLGWRELDGLDGLVDFGAPSAPLKSAEERRAEIMDELAAELDKVDRWYTVVCLHISPTIDYRSDVSHFIISYDT
jgi:hypothetical protein